MTFTANPEEVRASCTLHPKSLNSVWNPVRLAAELRVGGWAAPKDRGRSFSQLVHLVKAKLWDPRRRTTGHEVVKLLPLCFHYP